MTFSPISGRADVVAGSRQALSDPAHSHGVGPASIRQQKYLGTGAWPLHSYLELGALASAVPYARRHTRQVLWGWRQASLIESAELLVSELVTNAVVATQQIRPVYPVRLWLLSDSARTQIMVGDPSSHSPRRIVPGGDSEGGRGLVLVEALASRWGWYATRQPGITKVVWAELAASGIDQQQRPSERRPDSRKETVVGLGGTGRLADDLYLLAHHELSGKPYVQPRALGIGLAGGLLSELMLGDSIRLGPDGVVACHPLPQDGLAHHVLELVTGERERHPVRDWLLFIGRSAAEDVAHRLEQSGYVTRAGGRRGLWRGQRWVPVDADSAFAPLLRVRFALDPGRPLFVHGVALAGLATACGLGFRLTQYAPTRPSRSLDEAVSQLAPGLRELIAQTQAAVDSALLSHRV